MLVRRWQSADGRKKTAQVVVSQRKVDEFLTELHGDASGGHLGANKIMDKVRQRYYWLRLRRRREMVPTVRRLCRQSMSQDQESGLYAPI